jgi:hypothetical protein
LGLGFKFLKSGIRWNEPCNIPYHPNIARLKKKWLEFYGTAIKNIIKY